MTVFGHSKQVSPRSVAQWFGVFSLSLSAGFLGGDFASGELQAQQRVREVSRIELQQIREEAQKVLEEDTAQLLKLFKERSWGWGGIKAANGKTY